MVIVSGALEKPAGGSSPMEVFALFAILFAKVSASLQRQNKHANKIDPEFGR
jgi:hypothetical protein